VLQRQIGDLTISAAKCLHFLAQKDGGQNIWHRQEWRNHVTITLCIASVTWPPSKVRKSDRLCTHLRLLCMFLRRVKSNYSTLQAVSVWRTPYGDFRCRL